MSVSGTSSLHEWESDVTKVEWTGAFAVQGNQLIDIKDVLVKIPVTSIKSTKGSIMDNKTYDAFDYEKNPHIQFKLTTVKITGTAPEFTVNATGNLTMAGVSKPTDLVVKAKVLSTGEVQLTSSKKINMKNHNMKPPTAMMGTIKVGEEVTVAFDLTLTPKK
jgi:polyisoprenoid-binding protein YceI